MRLKSIKLAGFKSFVDPVTVPFDSSMTAIVGPNGCGKSNVIDAVRWVMGESSAKTLRGESMTDVIFNGSTGRKPVGQASIELLFDNRDGSMGGPYAQYAEIGVKRVVTRESQSSYFFNGQKCRRRDIADLFMGTGLGPRSYAIIGQGMISRLIEARPEELRSTLEEAAGISKYKERRRETENRMRRTQENLERLDDIREELDKQLERLKRQAEAARRYQTLKQQEHRLKGELALLRGRALRAQQGEQENRVRELEIQVEREILGQRQCESRLEESRQEHDRLAEQLEAHQARFYETGAAIARLEQRLEHARHQEQQLARELESARRELGELDELGEADAERLTRLDERLETLGPEQEEVAESLAELEASLDEAEAAYQDAQQRWESFTEADRQASHDAERAQDRVRNLERGLDALGGDVQRRRQQRDELPDQRELRERRETLNEQLAEIDLELESLEARRDATQTARDADREALREQEAVREKDRQRRSQLQGELASLEALIAASLDDQDAALDAWLAERGLADAPRLAEGLHVAPGWERAVSWVLASWLNARRLPALSRQALDSAPPSGELALVEGAADGPVAVAGTLAAQVEGAGAAAAMLARIRCAEDAGEAWALRASLAAGESVLSADGLWLGDGWARYLGVADGADSVLAQQRRRDAASLELERLEERLAECEQRLGELQARDAAHERALEEARVAERDLTQRRQQAALAEGNLASRLEHVDARARELDEDMASLQEQRETQALELEEAREQWQTAMGELEDSSQRRETLERQRRDAQEALAALRARLRPLQERSQQLALEHQRLTTERAGLAEQRTRSAETRARLEDKCGELEAQRETLREPEAEEREQLDELLDRRGREEQALNACRDEAQQIGERLRETEATRQQHERNLEGIRQQLEEGRMQVQALKLKADAQDEALAELGHAADALTETLDPEATESAWQTRLEEAADKVRRLGAINLAAIEEYDQQAERRDYLEGQHAELSEALETLDRRDSQDRPGNPDPIQGDIRAGQRGVWSTFSASFRGWYGLADTDRRGYAGDRHRHHGAPAGQEKQYHSSALGGRKGFDGVVAGVRHLPAQSGAFLYARRGRCSTR